VPHLPLQVRRVDEHPDALTTRNIVLPRQGQLGSVGIDEIGDTTHATPPQRRERHVNHVARYEQVEESLGVRVAQRIQGTAGSNLKDLRPRVIEDAKPAPARQVPQVSGVGDGCRLGVHRSSNLLGAPGKMTGLGPTGAGVATGLSEC
jgi:hypothetical protein